MDPSRNNMPLEFDMNKGKPPMPMVFSSSEDGGGDGPSAEAIAKATAAASCTNSLMTNTQYMANMSNQVGPRPPSNNSNMGGGGNMGPGNMGGGGNMQGNMGGGGNMGPGNMGGGGNMGPGNMGGGGNMQGNMGNNMQGNMGPNNMGGGNMGPNNMGGNMGGPMMGPMGPMGPNMMMGPMNMQFAAGFMGPMGPMGMMGPGPEGMGMGMMGPAPGPMGPAPGPMGPPPMQKELITLKSCVLYPPPADFQTPPVKERPPGCRTAFVGGLPDNVTDEILEEVFAKAGAIESVRLGKKNFAHIRFIKQDSVEKAMYISGYRMRIENKDDKANTGRIYVDYANARNDQYEFECEQRALARELRHQQQVQEERLRPPSPPSVAPFTIYDGNAMLETIKSDTGFMKACQTLVTWLERGSVDKRSVNLFYTLVQSSNSHVRRLIQERQQHEEELNQAKLLFKQRIQGILVQLGQIESVFTSALKQRNWDHFTKAQRKNMDSWYKAIKEEREGQQAQFAEPGETEMDFSDEDDVAKEPSTKRKRKAIDGVAASMEAAEQVANGQALNSLKEENDTLKCQLEAYKNENEMVKHEHKHNTEELEKRITCLQNALRGMQQQLMAHRAQGKGAEKKSENAESDEGKKDKEDEEAAESPRVSQDSSVSSSGIPLTGKEARMLGLICCFLNVHPSGATVDYLWSYLRQFITKLRPRDIEDLLDRLPALFQQKVAGVGATLERRWCFSGYDQDTDLL